LLKTVPNPCKVLLYFDLIYRDNITFFIKIKTEYYCDLEKN